MGFWDALKKFGPMAGAIAATVASGGAAAPLIGVAGKLSTLGKVAGMAGDIAGAVGKGREEGRDKENAQTMNQDAMRLQAMRDFENATMNRSDLELKQKGDSRQATESNFRNALLGALAKNMQDGSFNRPDGVPTIALSGGLRPSALGLEGRAAGEAMSAKALQSLLNGEEYADVAAPERFNPSEMKKGGVIDSILGAAGTVGNVANRVNADNVQTEQNSFIRKLLEQAQSQVQDSEAPIVGAGDFRVPVPASFKR